MYENATILHLDSRGSLDGQAFTLVGRTCVRGGRGAIWNEWTMAFDDGRTLYLAEAAGLLTVYEEGSLFPALSTLLPGRPLATDWIVVERGEACRVASWGRVPGGPPTYPYVDLSSPTGIPATIDLGEPLPRVFVGRRIGATELGLDPGAGAGAGALPPRPRPRLPRTADVSRPAGVEVWLNPGDAGDLGIAGVTGGCPVHVLGVLARSIEGPDGGRQRWEEYFLYPGALWLSVASGHWSLSRNVEPGLVTEDAGVATFDGERFAGEGETIARVDWAAGELPWEAAVGDVSTVEDFRGPGRTLTREQTPEDIAWSLAEPIPPDIVAKAFGKRALPKPI
jgi:hypothetical protein